MSYPDDLLETADELIGLKPVTQATLRRAVSTAYYALFHLLIEDACKLWVQSGHHGRLARQFDHRRMKEASNEFAKRYTNSSFPAEVALEHVATTFVQLQQRRHECDYDLSTSVSEFDASRDVYDVELAFEEWHKIKDERLAQDYLFSLLFQKRWS